MKKLNWRVGDAEMLEDERLPRHASAPTRPQAQRHTPALEGRPYLQFVDWESPELGETMQLNMGPQHPSTHGVLRIEVKLSGEEIQDLRCHIGYMHRCAEKESENSTYIQVVPYTDRLDYVAPMTNAYGYSLAVERLFGLKLPPEVEYFRMAVNELQRIASHLLAIATFGVDAGAFTPFLYAFEAREKLLKLFEYISGGHLLYNYIWPGGVQRPPPTDFMARVEPILREVEDCLRLQITPVLSDNRIFIDRTAAAGVLTPNVAFAYAITGPNLRGSGVARDLRKDEPYALYSTVDFDICLGRGQYGPCGSSLDRYLVRVDEIRESIKIVRQCLARVPAQLDVHAGLPSTWKAPPAECYYRSETARGELGIFLISDGTERPYRCKYRSPGFHAIQVLPEISRGHLFGDLPIIIGSLDFVMCEVDR